MRCSVNSQGPTTFVPHWRSKPFLAELIFGRTHYTARVGGNRYRHRFQRVNYSCIVENDMEFLLLAAELSCGILHRSKAGEFKR